jgi:hypothetical protein
MDAEEAGWTILSLFFYDLTIYLTCMYSICTRLAGSEGMRSKGLAMTCEITITVVRYS